MTNTFKTLILLTGMLLSLGQAAAQSKKEQIAALNNRVDSLYRVLSEERSDCAKALQTNAQTIQEQSEEIVQLTAAFTHTSDTLASRTKSLENSLIKLQQARDSIGALSSAIAVQEARRDCEMVDLMRFDEFSKGIEWNGWLGFTRETADGWDDHIGLSWYWGPSLDKDALAFDVFKLVPGKYYWVTFTLGADRFGEFIWYAEDVKPATDEDVSNRVGE